MTPVWPAGLSSFVAELIVVPLDLDQFGDIKTTGGLPCRRKMTWETNALM
jgi:hypothetical protein